MKLLPARFRTALLSGRRLTFGLAATSLSLLAVPALGQGQLDPAFDGDGKATTSLGASIGADLGAAIQSDGKIVVAGSVSNNFFVVRYNTNGTLDTSFDGDGIATTDVSGNDAARAVAIQSDGKIVVGGSSGTDFAVVRYEANGSLDTSFDLDGKVTIPVSANNDWGSGLGIQSDGKIIIGGYANTINPLFCAVRLSGINGSLDSSYGTGGIATVSAMGTNGDQAYGLCVQSDNKVVLVGGTVVGSGFDVALARLTTTGVLDTSFSGDGKQVTQLAAGTAADLAFAVAQSPTTSELVLTGRRFHSTNLNDDSFLLIYNSVGTLTGNVTLTFGTASEYGRAVAVQGDGKIVVAGEAQIGGTQYDVAVARFSAAGALDTSWDGDGKLTTAIGPGWDNGRAVRIQSDGNVVVAATSDNASFVTELAAVRYLAVPTIPDITVQEPVGNFLTDNSGSVNFGQTPLLTPVTKTFTIGNNGSGTITGLAITKDGTHAGDFSFTALSTTTLAIGATTTFDVTFNPSVDGVKVAALHIASNDPDENTFDIALSAVGGDVPEIVVEHPAGTGLTDNSGSINCGGALVNTAAAPVTFTVRNTGTAPLSGLNISKDGAHPADFDVSPSSLATIAPGGSTTFTVTLTPAAAGARTAAIHIASNDFDENPFDIALTGTGQVPEIAVEHPVSKNLSDNGAAVSFGSGVVGSSSAVKTFTIRNTGTSNLSGIAVTKDGANEADYTLDTTGTSASVAPGGSTTFAVTFKPSATGARPAALHIASNDSDEAPFDIPLTGHGVTTLQVAQEAYLKASNTGTDDRFGASVAVSGDTVVVGSFWEDSPSAANPELNTIADSGAAYVYVRNGSTWTQQAYLKASNPGSNDQFGFTVAIDGDTIVIGAFVEDSGSASNQADNTATDAGAVYVFTRSGSTWSQQAYLKASNIGAGDRFGGALAISGETLLISSYFEDSNATGVNGDQANNSISNDGAAYVFTRSGTTWTQQAYLKGPHPGADDQFGISVGLSGDTAVIGEHGDDSNAPGVNTNWTDNSLGDAGAAIVFKRTGTSWAQEAYIKASNPGGGDLFGFSSAIDGDTIVIGSIREDSNATGINGGDNNLSTDAGAAYIFTRSGNTWTQQAYVKPSNTGTDNFGRSVAVAGDTMLVGANLEDSNATGINGDGSNNLALDAGAAYAFQRTGTSWQQVNYLKGGNTQAGDQLGYYVALSGTTAVVGAFSEDSSTTGVNSTPNESALTSGAAYVFTNLGNGEISVEQAPGTVLSDGGTSNVGSQIVSTSGAPVTYTIRNTSAGPLINLAVTKDGSHQGDFALDTTGMATSLAAGASTTFTVTFTPGAGGLRSAALHVASNDGDENPFDIALEGNGAAGAPEIAVEQPEGSGLEDDVSEVSFGAVLSGTPAARTFTIRNAGSAMLTLGTITKDGGDEADFSITQPASNSLTPGATTTFEVSFSGTGPGLRTAALHIPSNDGNENPFDIDLSATVTSPEIAIEQPETVSLSDGSAVIAYGALPVGDSSAKTFTIRNSGDGNLTGLVVSVDGADAGDFDISQPLLSTLPPGGSTTFEVAFNPGTEGTKEAVIHVANSDANENPFDIAVSGVALGAEIVVEHPSGSGLNDGEATVQIGEAVNGFPVSRTLTIRNTGAVPLTGITVSFTDAGDVDFAVSGPQPEEALPPGGSTTFAVAFNPASPGAKTATLHIASSDLSENPFDVALEGTGIAPEPEIAIEQPEASGLTDGGPPVSFGTTPSGTPVVKTFTIRNTGTATLNLDSLITKDGTDAADFTVDAPLSLILAPAATTTFDVTFHGTGSGTRSAAIHIGSDDADEALFDISLSATVTSPEIAIEHPANTNLADASSLPYGELPVGDSRSKTFTIRNTGDGDLTGLFVTIDGTDAGDFDISQPLLSSLPPGESTTFEVAFNPGSAGDKTATIHIANNDADESPFDLGLSGAGTVIVEDWREQYFGTSENEGDAADDADPDHDGLPNVIEFAFDLDPTVPGTLQQLPTPERDEEAGVFVVSFEEPLGITGIVYGAEYASADLDTWLPIPDTGSGRNHVFAVPMADKKMIFIRLLVVPE